MSRKLKTLGLAMVAVLAMSAVVASTAQAQWTASSYPTTITGTSATGNDDIKLEAGSVECAAHFEGTTSEASTTITIKATYTKCKAFGFAEATVNMEGCDYVFHSNGEFDLECPSGNHMRIIAGACEVDLTSQTGLHSIKIFNDQGDIVIDVVGTGLSYTVTKDGFLCPFNGTGFKTGGTYTQNNGVTMKSTGSSTISVD